jgi:hypothetical protein
MRQGLGRPARVRGARAHADLEAALSTWLGTEETVVFTTGYAANVGAIAALAGEGDLVVSTLSTMLDHRRVPAQPSPMRHRCAQCGRRGTRGTEDREREASLVVTELFQHGG